MAVKHKGSARAKQREKRRVAKAARHTPKKTAAPVKVRRKINREGPVPQHMPQADGDSTPLHETHINKYDSDLLGEG